MTQYVVKKLSSNFCQADWRVKVAKATPLADAVPSLNFSKVMTSDLYPVDRISLPFALLLSHLNEGGNNSTEFIPGQDSQTLRDKM